MAIIVQIKAMQARMSVSSSKVLLSVFDARGLYAGYTGAIGNGETAGIRRVDLFACVRVNKEL
jgi:hypothetical protein